MKDNAIETINNQDVPEPKANADSHCSKPISSSENCSKNNHPTEKELNTVDDTGLSGVSGGAIFHATGKALDPDHRYEVVDDISGRRIARFSTRSEAEDYCRKKNLSTKNIVFFNTVRKMEDAYNQHQKYLPDDKYWRNPHL